MTDINLRFRNLPIYTQCMAAMMVTEADASLLAGETDGLAIDFTDTTYFNMATGDQDWVQERNASVDTLQSPHLFFTQSGTSPKYVKTSATGIGWSPHNMFLNSAVPATQNVTLVTGFNYTVTVTGAGGGDITGSSGASGTATTGTPATFTATGTTGTFTLTGSLDTIQLNRGIASPTHLVTAGAAVIGLPISYAEGLLVEPEATNIQLRSQEIDNAQWAKTNCTISANATTAPDGSTTADKVVEASDTAQTHFLSNLATVVSGSVYTQSVYAKAAERAWLLLYASSTGFPNDPRCNFNLGSGTIGSAFDATGTMVSVGDGWYRCSITMTADASTPNGFSYYIGEGDTDVTYNGDGTSGIYLWGAQVETGSVATSHIPTVTATATRAVDNVTFAVSTIPYSLTAGTVVQWYVPQSTLALHRNLFGFHTSTTEEVTMYMGDADAGLFMFVEDANVLSVNLDSGHDVVGGTLSKIASAWAANDAAIVVNGGSQVTDASVTLPDPITSGRFGSAGVPSKGAFQRIIYVPRRMTEAEMQAETT